MVIQKRYMHIEREVLLWPSGFSMSQDAGFIGSWMKREASGS